jgi:hypothetical protein
MEDRDQYLDEMRRYLEQHPDSSPPPKEKILLDAMRKVWEENGKDISSFHDFEGGARIEPLNKGMSIEVLEENNEVTISLEYGVWHGHFDGIEAAVEIVQLSLLGKARLRIIYRWKIPVSSNLILRSKRGDIQYQFGSCLALLLWWLKKTEIEISYSQ